jgi:hypothetical protein
LRSPLSPSYPHPRIIPPCGQDITPTEFKTARSGLPYVRFLYRDAAQKSDVRAAPSVEFGTVAQPVMVRARPIAIAALTVISAPPHYPAMRGRFSAPAAHEPDHRVDAHVFHLRTDQQPMPAAEILAGFDLAARLHEGVRTRLADEEATPRPIFDQGGGVMRGAGDR